MAMAVPLSLCCLPIANGSKGEASLHSWHFSHAPPPDVVDNHSLPPQFLP